MEGAPPVGTLECPDGWVLDEALNMCKPENPIDVSSHGVTDFTGRLSDIPKGLRPKKVKKKKGTAADENAAPFKSTDKMERCIQDVKARLRKSQKTFKDQSIKSAAIAICRSRLKQ